MSVDIPPDHNTVKVYIISPNRVLDVPPAAFLTPDIKGTTYKDTPCLSFLVKHVNDAGVQTRLLFDLGIRKDWENLPPLAADAVRSMNITIATPQDVASQLESHSIDTSSIQSIFFSHWHFDHVGDATRFSAKTKVIVGPGFKEALLPGYPKNPESLLNNDAFEGREVQELDFSAASNAHIASLPAIDWFGDGSFFILHTPGHAVGHISALARTSAGPSVQDDKFIFLAGDVCHHAGELRPSSVCPIPDSVTGHEMDRFKTLAEYSSIHPHRCCDQPFYKPSVGGFNLDADQMQTTVRNVQKLDADKRVFVLLAHDNWLLDIVDTLPNDANGWFEKGWAEKSRWRFLQDFQL